MVELIVNDPHVIAQNEARFKSKENDEMFDKLMAETFDKEEEMSPTWRRTNYNEAGPFRWWWWWCGMDEW